MHEFIGVFFFKQKTAYEIGVRLVGLGDVYKRQDYQGILVLSSHTEDVPWKHSFSGNGDQLNHVEGRNSEN